MEAIRRDAGLAPEVAWPCFHAGPAMRSGQFLILVLLLLALLLGRAAARLTVGAVYLAQATLQNGVDAPAAGGQARATGTPRHRPTRHALSRPTIQQRRAQWGQPNPKPAGSSLFAALSRYKSFMVTTMTATGSGLRLRRQGQRGPPPGCSSKQGPCRPPLPAFPGASVGGEGSALSTVSSRRPWPELPPRQL